MTSSKTFGKLCIFIGCTVFLCCSPATKLPYSNRSSDPNVAEVEEHRYKKHNEFLSDKSPLPADERKKFKGLHYYPIDLSYQVKARFIPVANSPLFKMKTTTTRLPDYRKYADVVFTLQGKEYKLEVYQSPDLMKKSGYEDYLFVPFTDETNGKETYEVGRYLELRIPQGEEVVLDFNKCYNPYCSYSPNYSCPIPPAANHLPLEIKAGEMKYKDH
jgi:uncharacterized protein